MPTNTLIRLQEAAQLWYSTIAGSQTQGLVWSQTVCPGTSPCANGSANNLLSPQYVSSAPTATLIGTDSAGIGYFHLTSFNVRCALLGVTCIVPRIYPSGACYATPLLLSATLANQTVAITDGGSTPLSSGGIAPVIHSGYPVVAAAPAYTDGSGNIIYVAFAGGDASALTVAAAQTACGITDEDFSNVTCSNTAISIVVDGG